MDRFKFVSEFNKASCELDKRSIKKVIKRSVDSNTQNEQRGQHNLIIVMEELAELSQQTSKVMRGRCDKVGLLEEMADVAVGLLYLQEICDISTLDLYKAINVKIDRLDYILKEKGVYL